MTHSKGNNGSRTTDRLKLIFLFAEALPPIIVISIVIALGSCFNLSFVRSRLLHIISLSFYKTFVIFSLVLLPYITRFFFVSMRQYHIFIPLSVVQLFFFRNSFFMRALLFHRLPICGRQYFQSILSIVMVSMLRRYLSKKQF